MADPSERERAVFDAARRLPAEQRAGYLDQACAGDAALRQNVESLLRASDEAGPFLQSPAAAPLGAKGTIRLVLEPAEKPGDQIGRYKLLQQIGEGGCGVVYMAEQEEPVRRRVALKVIKLGMDTKSVIARFEAERQALAMMDHPNIAKVLDAGATDKGRPYFVMELVRGIKITDYCDQNNLSTRARLDLFVQVCRAVQHAHQKGIIHRDIKPSNILVTMSDGVPVPKVIDFGIAKATQGKLTDHTLFTAFEQFIGTPAYMSPEQAEMSAMDIDTRSDLYSLGVLLYELLTGNTPFDATELLRAGLDEMRRQIREKEPVRPSTRLSSMTAADLTSVAAHRQSAAPKLVHLVRGDLDWIVMKCLEKDRTRRYDTANGLAADVQRYLKNEPVLASPPSNFYKFQKLVRRNKLAFAGATLMAAVLVAATCISLWQATLAKRRLVEAESISKFLTEVFRSPDPARDSRTITVAEALGAAAKKLDTDLAGQPARQAKLQATLAMTYYTLGLVREAIPLQEKVRDYDQAAFGTEHPDTIAAMHQLALLYQKVGRRDEALKMQEQVLALRRKVNGPEDPGTLWAMNNLSFSYEDGGRYAEALKLREEALALRRKVNGPEHPDTVWAMNVLAISYDNAGRWKEALNLREEVSALNRKMRGPEHPDTLLALGYLSSSYENLGRLDEALKLRETVVEARRRVSGPEHPDTLCAMHDLASSYDEAGRRDEALKMREEVLALRRKVLGPEHNNTLWSMDALANSYDEAGRRDEALKLREETFALRREINGPAHADTLATMGNLAISYDEAGRYDEALRLRETALPLLRKALGPENPDTLTAMNNLANSYHQTGRTKEAIKLDEEVLPLCRKVEGPEHPDTIRAMHNLANCYDGDGRENEALHLREEVLPLYRKVNGPEHPYTLAAINDLAVSYAEAGRKDQALQLREEVLPLFRKAKGPEHPDTIKAMSNLAFSYDQVGRENEALKLREEVLALRRKVSGPQSLATLGTLNTIAWSLATSDSPGIRDGARALNLAQEAVTATHHTNADFLNTLAVAYAATQQFDKAAALQQEAIDLVRDAKQKDDFVRQMKLFQANKPYQARPNP
jgi:eukaryotic-like serine/threonine-protein kinase